MTYACRGTKPQTVTDIVVREDNLPAMSYVNAYIRTLDELVTTFDAGQNQEQTLRTVLGNAPWVPPTVAGVFKSFIREYSTTTTEYTKDVERFIPPKVELPWWVYRKPNGELSNLVGLYSWLSGIAIAAVAGGIADAPYRDFIFFLGSFGGLVLSTSIEGIIDRYWTSKLSAQLTAENLELKQCLEEGHKQRIDELKHTYALKLLGVIHGK